MRRLCIITLILAAALLTGCGSGGEERQFAEFSSALRERSSLRFTADVRAELLDHTARLTLAYAGSGKKSTVTVMKPDSLAGITLRYEDGSSRLEYGSLSIDTGLLDDSGLTPASALPMMVKALCCGALDSCAREGGETVWHVVPEDGVSVSLWVDSETLVPTHAELALNGRTTLYCDISDWE